MLDTAAYPLEQLARKIGTPFFLCDAGALGRSAAALAALASGPPDAPDVAVRYAMKANSRRAVLRIAREAGLWIDAVSGNEVVRALGAGFPAGVDPPVIMLTTDVLRDNALAVVLEHRVLPNLGSPAMVAELRDGGYRGPIAVRVNPGFGHGHVQSTDTGGPSSKHGIWPDDLAGVLRNASQAGLSVVGLHAHVGSGPEPDEFDANMRNLVHFFADLLPRFPAVAAVNLGGGVPYPYRPDAPRYELGRLHAVLREARTELGRAAGRSVRVEIEPGRHLVAGAALLVARVKDVKRTRENPRGPGHTFVMVDAGFCDLVRPAMYGAYHHMEVVGRPRGTPVEPCVVAGPLCESGDVFTRDARELLDPRPLPRPEPGDLLVLHDAGAYGAAMSSNYVSLGRAPEVLWDEGRATLIARRETVEDVIAAECEVPL